MTSKKHYEHVIKLTSELIPYINNSRTHSDEQISQIASSMKEFGFTNPVLIDEQGGLIAGHGRVMAATKLSIKEIPCIVLDGLTDAQKKAYIIADNQLPLNAGWDLDKLKLELENLDELNFDLDLLGFDDDFLNGLMIEETEGLTDEDAVPEPPETPITVLGDIWTLGNHRLMCGDSTSIDAVDKLMDGNKADMVFTDPPYGVSWRSNKSKRFDVLMNDDKILDIAAVVEMVMDDNTAAFIWTAQSVYPIWRDQFEDSYKSTIIWNKGGGAMGDLKGDFMPTYEMALYCRRGKPSFSVKRPPAVWDIKKDASTEYAHPTQKPVALAEYAMSLFVGRAGIISDLFGGSGSTLIACEKTNRHCRMMELDEKYVDVIINRWQEFTGKEAIHSNGKTYNELKSEQDNGG